MPKAGDGASGACPHDTEDGRGTVEEGCQTDKTTSELPQTRVERALTPPAKHSTPALIEKAKDSMAKGGASPDLPAINARGRRRRSCRAPAGAAVVPLPLAAAP